VRIADRHWPHKAVVTSDISKAQQMARFVSDHGQNLIGSEASATRVVADKDGGAEPVGTIAGTP
jgi:hypothetical protein